MNALDSVARHGTDEPSVALAEHHQRRAVIIVWSEVYLMVTAA